MHALHHIGNLQGRPTPWNHDQSRYVSNYMHNPGDKTIVNINKNTAMLIDFAWQNKRNKLN